MDTGVFSWQPSETDGPSTNHIGIIVTDNGVPPLSATQTLVVVVRDTQGDFVLSLGRTNVFAGTTNSIPIVLRSGLELTKIVFELTGAAPRLTNLTFTPTLHDWVKSSSLVPSQGRHVLTFELATNVVSGENELGRLGFTATTAGASADVSLGVQGLYGIDAAGRVWDQPRTQDGRVIVIEVEPVLDVLAAAGGKLDLILYGLPGHNYLIEKASNLEPAEWSVIDSRTAVESRETVVVPIDGAAGRQFYRVREE